MIGPKERAARAAPRNALAGGNSGRSKFTTTPVTDTMLARYLGVRRSRVWSLIARGDIAPPNQDNGTTMYWSGLMLKLLTRDLETGKAVHR